MENNFFMLVGAKKCGTTTLHDWLNQHPDIVMSDKKEPQFFEREYARGFKYYESKYFQGRKGKIYGEARALNLTIDYVPERILEFNPNTKIIICIRDPAKRFVSAWLQFVKMRPGRETRDLPTAIAESFLNDKHNLYSSEERFCSHLDIKGGPFNDLYFETGLYEKYIKRYSDMFDTKVVIMERLNNPAVYAGLLAFLDVDQFIPDYNIKNVGNKYENEECLRFLKYLYRDSVESLSNYLHEDLTREWGYI